MTEKLKLNIKDLDESIDKVKELAEAYKELLGLIEEYQEKEGFDMKSSDMEIIKSRQDECECLPEAYREEQCCDCYGCCGCNEPICPEMIGTLDTVGGVVTVQYMFA